MRKFILSAIALLAGATLASAQDFNNANATFEKAKEALEQGKFEEAAKGFKDAAEEASKCSETNAGELVDACKKNFTTAMYSGANQLVKDGKLDDAIEKLSITIKAAEENKYEDIEAKAKNLKQQVVRIYANNQIKAAAVAKNADEKIACYSKAIEKFDILIAEGLDDARIYLQKGQVLKSMGKQEEAIASFMKAKEMGDEAGANKQLSKLYLQEAQAKLAQKNYSGAIESALKATEYENSATAYKIAGTAANNDKKTADAIKYLSKYLELAPDAKDAAQIKDAISSLNSQIGK